MKKIEKDLFRILKNCNEDEFYYILMKMVNNTYNYEYKYLNDIPYNEILLNLEKIMVLTTGNNKDIESIEDIYNLVNDFYDNIKKNNNRVLNKINLVSLKYDAKIFKERLKRDKKVQFKTASSLFLTGVLFVSLLSNTYAKEQSIAPDVEVSNTYFEDKSISMPLKEDKKGEVLDEDIVVFDKKEKEEDVSDPNGGTTTSLDDMNEKVNFILDKYNLTSKQFDVLCAIVMAEAKYNSYEDAYAVINTIYNRTISKEQSSYISRAFKVDGTNLYYQATAKGQFVVYEHGSYKKYLGVRNMPGYQAVVDFLYSGKIMHNYLFFRDQGINLGKRGLSEYKEGSNPNKTWRQFVKNGGNKYFGPLQQDDILEKEEGRSR